MNEKIKDLAEQCGFRSNPDIYDRNQSFDIEKFAELIVEECRYVMDCNKGSDQNPVWNQALWETSEKIKQYFGVEYVAPQSKHETEQEPVACEQCQQLEDQVYDLLSKLQLAHLRLSFKRI